MEHNVFVSYAWVDNETYPGADKGWVSTFVDGLRKHLARELGRRDEAERLWLDYEQMRGNESVTPAIRSHIEAARTLVLILSDGYVASTWCRQELATFVEKFGSDGGRIFVVQMSPVDQEPEALRDLVKYRFWYLDDKNQPRTRWFPLIDPTDREYSPEQERLARELADKLRDLWRDEARAGTTPSGQGRVAQSVASEAGGSTAEAQPITPAQVAADRFVLVNGGVEDRELVYAIARRLEQHNLGVAIPLSAMDDQAGVKSSAITRDLRTKLGLCDSVLMVFRRGPRDQVSQHLVECLKVCTKAAKGRRPPTIDLCQTQSDPLALGLRASNMRIHVVGEACAEECVQWFLDGAST